MSFGLFGTLLHELAPAPAGAVQFSPLVPGASALEDAAAGSLEGLAMAASPGTIERRYALALGLRALRPGAPLTAMAPKTKGGNRIAKELESFGCDVTATSARHQRICMTARPTTFGTDAQARIDAAIADGAPRRIAEIDLWSQPGIFCWDRIDAGSALLLKALPALSGRGADLGCGIGVLSRAVLSAPGVTQLDLIDIDRRAIAAARRNITDPRAKFHWDDVRKTTALKDLDFVVMNPPFHDGGIEDRALGEAFLKLAYRNVRAGGAVWLVANVHLPYEAILSVAFSKLALKAEEGGYKVYEATK